MERQKLYYLLFFEGAYVYFTLSPGIMQRLGYCLQ